MSARLYAELAREAYTAAPDIGDEDSAVRAILRQTDDGLAMAFRGTDNLLCWLADLHADAIPAGKLGRLHHGFWQAYCSADAALMRYSPDVICGHSEGAALALIYAGMLCLAKPARPPKAVFAFEPPHVCADDKLGDLLAANGVALTITRNGNDVVPIIPRVLYHWRHPGPVRAIGKARWPVPNIEDHAIASVIEALEA